MNSCETPIEAWRDIGTGIMVCVRMPDGGETVYMGAANKQVDERDLEAASRWLQSLAQAVGS